MDILRNELASKNTIIEMLIKDKLSVNSSDNSKYADNTNNNDSFVFPKIPIIVQGLGGVGVCTSRSPQFLFGKLN